MMTCPSITCRATYALIAGILYAQVSIAVNGVLRATFCLALPTTMIGKVTYFSSFWVLAPRLLFLIVQTFESVLQFVHGKPKRETSHLTFLRWHSVHALAALCLRT